MPLNTAIPKGKEMVKALSLLPKELRSKIRQADRIAVKIRTSISGERASRIYFVLPSESVPSTSTYVRNMKAGKEGTPVVLPAGLGG